VKATPAAWLAGLVLAVCSCGGSGAAGTTTPHEVNPPSGTILFEVASRGEGPERLYGVDTTGSRPRLINARSCCGQLLPGGRSVVDLGIVGGKVVEERFDLHDGKKSLGPVLQRGGLILGSGPLSPDGKMFAVEGYDDHDHALNGLYTVRLSNGHGTRLTAWPAHDLPIAFSPDGSRILFLRPISRSNTNAEPNMNLYIVNTDGSGLRRLNPPGTVTGLNDTPTVSDQSWSPDGRRVAFVASRAADGAFFDAPRTAYVVNADGTGLHAIGQSGFSAVWSPDGRWIAVDHQNTGPTALYLVHPDGTGQRPIAAPTDGSYTIGPVWSPDGSWLLYLRGTGNGVNHADLWTTSADGKTTIRLTHQPGPYRAYSWNAAG
jgi:TolB protein